MHKFLPALLFVVMASGLSAQITLTTDYFPVAGDTLRFVVADSTFANNVDLMPEGGNDLAWDFSGAVGSSNLNEPVDAANDAEYPDADVSITSFATTSFYRSTATSFDLVGVRTEFDLFPGLVLSTPVIPVRPIRRAPLNLGDTFTSTTENSVTISPDSIPAEVLAELGSVIASVDSIRITTISVRSDEVDAFGTVRLLGNFYPVLREKRTEAITIRLAVQTLPLDFTDVTGTITLFNPDIGALLGEQPITETYLFWNDESKEPIVEATTDMETGTVTRMLYKRAQQSTSTEGPGLLPAQVKVYPNPATDLATFEIEGLASGTYTLQLIDMVGRKVAQREFSPFGTQTRLSLDVSELRSGLYLYSLRNEQGRRIVTKRLRVR